MNSSAQPSRRIASNLLWTPQGLLRNPLVGVAADGLGRKNFEDTLETWRDVLGDFRASLSP